MLKILKLTLVVFSINIFSQFAQEEIDLSNEYISMLSSSNYDQSRIDEIESIAVSNKKYEYLRIYIAGTYFFNHPSREIHTKKDIYKRLLKPNFDSRQFNSIPISTFAVAMYEDEYEQDFVDELEKRITAGDVWSRINLAAYYYYKIQPEKALEILGNVYKKRIGLFFNTDELIVDRLMPNTSVPFMKKGDKVLSLNTVTVSNLNDFSKELEKYEPGSTQTIVYKRNNKTLKSEFIVKEEFDFMISPYAALLHLNTGDTFEASKLINDFRIYEVDASMMSSALYEKLEGINDSAFCRLNLDPNIKDLQKRFLAIGSCKNSLSKLEKGILIEGTNPGFFEYQLHQYNPFWGISYADVVSLLSATYMKNYGGFGLGLEQEKHDFDLAKKYIEKSPFIYSNSEAIKLASIEIYKDGDNVPEKQYKNISNQTFQTLNNLVNAPGSPGYLARYHLLNIYKYDDKYKDFDKAYEIATKAYELDKKNYPRRIISLSELYYYGYGKERNKKKSHELLEEFARAYESNPIEVNHGVIWAFDVLARNYHFGKVVKQDLNKSFKYGKIIEGKNDSIDILNASKIIDGDVDVSKEMLNQTLASELILEMLEKENLNSYVAYKAFAGIKPFVNTDIPTACKFASNDPEILSNYISQYIYSYCVLTEEIKNEKYDYKNFLKTLSNKGSSEATWILFNLELGKNEKTSKELKNYLVKSNQQLKQDTSKDLVDNIFWLNETTIFDVSRKNLDADFLLINNRIKEDEDFARAIAKAEEEKERMRLAEIRKANRREAAEKTGNFLGNLLEFTFKAALVVGAAAVVGDAIDDAPPEVIQALSDSMSNSYQTYTYDWDGFYDVYGNWTYRCRTIENGRFAEDYHCYGKIQDDDRWPTY